MRLSQNGKKNMINAVDKPTLLIVDDEQNFTESLQFALEDEFTVSIAASLKIAREALKKTTPAAILLDLRLPDGEGIELLYELKESSKLSVVIIMTAYATVESIVAALSKGAVDYFIKPLDIEKLKIKLRMYSESLGS
jgi:DNA-binding NtrC family response regulator